VGSRLAIFRQKIAFGAYELSGHAKDEMEQDGFTIRDVNRLSIRVESWEFRGMAAAHESSWWPVERRIVAVCGSCVG